MDETQKDPKRQAAGRLGGKATSTRGREFYSTIGKLGGAASKAKAAPGHYQELGRQGGQAVTAKYPGHHSRIGKMGGAVVSEAMALLRAKRAGQ